MFSDLNVLVADGLTRPVAIIVWGGNVEMAETPPTPIMDMQQRLKTISFLKNHACQRERYYDTSTKY